MNLVTQVNELRSKIVDLEAENKRLKLESFGEDGRFVNVEIGNLLTRVGVPEFADGQPHKALTLVERVAALCNGKLELICEFNRLRDEVKVLVTNNESLVAREEDLLDQLYTANNRNSRNAPLKEVFEHGVSAESYKGESVPDTVEKLVDDAIDLLFEGTRRDVYAKLLDLLQVVNTSK